MKKQVKKLKLAKETLRSLEAATLNEVMGASSPGFDCTQTCRFCNPDSNGEVC